MSNLPHFITFTGADDYTSIDGMLDLADEYPIEWGILFSRDRQGQGRYPSFQFVDSLVSRMRLRPEDGDRLRLSAHICGQHGRDIATRSACDLDSRIRGIFKRVQINIASSTLNMLSTGMIARWARDMQAAPILQCHDAFPQDLRFSWLADSSGGRGIERERWPILHSVWHARSTLKGYAGGLGPANVRKHVEAIGFNDRAYWLDMESQVRDENDRFDLARCLAVCEAVYGPR